MWRIEICASEREREKKKLQNNFFREKNRNNRKSDWKVRFQSGKIRFHLPWYELDFLFNIYAYQIACEQLKKK